MHTASQHQEPVALDPLAHLPAIYALQVVGDCLAPDLADGSFVVVDRDADYEVGDFVVVYPIPNARDKTPIVKRLVSMPWKMRFPYFVEGEANVVPLIELEMNNPRRRMHVSASDIGAIHKVTEWGDDAAAVVDG